mgnify:CR=1 FL=1|tara:strand:+ start:472 stop:1299 length:828 start_codon:yes stop_codon:yes gene_type:complete
MSTTFKRPMFRKGGTTGGGIMDNVVERGQYADSNAKDIKGLSIKDKISLVESLGGPETGLGDPLTQFLLQVGPNIATTTGKGGIIPNILEGSKKPIADLISAQRARKKTKQAIGLEFIKDLSDDDKIALQEKIEYLMSEEGGGFSKQEAFNRVLPEFRKGRNPDEQAKIDTSSDIDSIINSTKNRFNVPKIDRLQGEILYDNLQALQKSNPEAYSTFVGAKSSSKYIFGSNEYKADTGEINKDSILTTIPDGFVIYDIEKGKFLKKQGNKIIGLE